MSLTFASTFAGVGGFDYAWEQLGMRCVLQVEIDANRREHLSRHWPDVPKGADIVDVSGTELGRPDILVGGFPCKDISIGKGKRKGLAGSRSGLFWEFHRLAEQHLRLVDACRPRWTILENVPGLLTSNDGRDLAAVLMALELIGYGWAYRVVDSRGTYGSPQRRPRAVIVGHRGGDPRPARLVLADTPGRLVDLEVRAEQAREQRAGTRRAAEEAGIQIFRKSARPRATAEEGGYATYKEDGFFNVLNNNDSRSNAMQTHIIMQGGRLRAPTPIEWERAQGFPDDWTLGMTPVKNRSAEEERMEALGDAMHVETATGLGRNIIEVDREVPLLEGLVA